MSMSEHPINR